jgi:hypothetical protein
MATAKIPKDPKQPKATNAGSLKNLNWFKAAPGGCQRPAPEYSTSGVFAYEKTIDEDGRPHYRRALWSKILESADSPDAWLNAPRGIWSPVNQ